MLEIKKVTLSDEELDKRMVESLERPPEQCELVEVACYPMTDGCCIKKGAS